MEFKIIPSFEKMLKSAMYITVKLIIHIIFKLTKFHKVKKFKGAVFFMIMG
jgi:hypothetical protein